jgi:hypothetical protein
MNADEGKENCCQKEFPERPTPGPLPGGEQGSEARSQEQFPSWEGPGVGGIEKVSRFGKSTDYKMTQFTRCVDSMTIYAWYVTRNHRGLLAQNSGA